MNRPGGRRPAAYRVAGPWAVACERWEVRPARPYWSRMDELTSLTYIVPAFVVVAMLDLDEYVDLAAAALICIPFFTWSLLLPPPWWYLTGRRLLDRGGYLTEGGRRRVQQTVDRLAAAGRTADVEALAALDRAVASIVATRYWNGFRAAPLRDLVDPTEVLCRVADRTGSGPGPAVDAALAAEVDDLRAIAEVLRTLEGWERGKSGRAAAHVPPPVGPVEGSPSAAVRAHLEAVRRNNGVVLRFRGEDGVIRPGRPGLSTGPGRSGGPVGRAR